jgi:type IV secretory pathway TraG/TraD family ATPase VirD4
MGPHRSEVTAVGISGYKTLFSEGKTYHSANKDQSTNRSEVKENLLTVAEILELPSTQMICLIRGKSPAKFQSIKWYKMKQYSSIVSSPPGPAAKKND